VLLLRRRALKSAQRQWPPAPPGNGQSLVLLLQSSVMDSKLNRHKDDNWEYTIISMMELAQSQCTILMDDNWWRHMLPGCTGCMLGWHLQK
jgi:hypothetical protein